MHDVTVYCVFLIARFVLSTSNESKKLIEKCSSPWTPYNTRASSLECTIKCDGKAFHTNEGKLICFNEKGVSYSKLFFGRKIRSAKNIKCECGYIVPSMNRKWLPCENNIIETSTEICDEICARTTVYLYKRSQIRTVIYCENEERNEFYDIVGQNGRLIYYTNTTILKYRECTCGIANTELTPIIKVKKLSSSAVSFQQCSKPWETLEFSKIAVMETCKIRCQQVCKRGSGIIRKGEALCFMRQATAKRRTPFHGAVEGACECGYIKKNNGNAKYPKCEREFIPCDPPISRNGSSGKKICDQFCSKTTVYINKKMKGQLSIRCIQEPGSKPEPLVGKCDERIYQKKTNNVTKNFAKCSCGIEKLLDEHFLKNPIAPEKILEQLLPDSWLVKKKRSIRSYENRKQKL